MGKKHARQDDEFNAAGALRDIEARRQAELDAKEVALEQDKADAAQEPENELRLAREMLDARGIELAALRKINEDWTRTRLALADGFIAEREDLMSRVHRIDLRLKALGIEYPPPAVASTRSWRLCDQALGAGGRSGDG